MASFGEGLTYALLGGTAEMGRGIQERGKEDRAASVRQKRETALANIKAANEATMQTRREEEAERGRQATAEEKRLDREAQAEKSKLDREARGEQARLDRESRERIAAQKDADPLGSEDPIEGQADAYANERVKEQAGWFETDAKSFKDFGGSRAKAREFYRNEFLQGRTGGQPTGGDSGQTTETRTPPTSDVESGYSAIQTRLIDAVREKNPNATDEQIVAALKNNEKYSKYFD